MLLANVKYDDIAMSHEVNVPAGFDPAIARHYQTHDENARLSSAAGQIEFLRTMDLLTRYLPPPPARILDIGGATGPYSQALGQVGYETHLLDPMSIHVEAARKRPGLASARVGDARKLDWPGAFADVVLLMGPLYHLVSAADRHQALLEARRVLKKRGLLVVAAISRFASFFDGLTRGFIDDPSFQSILMRVLDSGQHGNPTANRLYFTHSYFHLPEELAAEITQAQFVQAQVFAVEGPVWTDPNLEARLANPQKRRFLLDVLRSTERQPSFLGASPHLLAFAYST